MDLNEYKHLLLHASLEQQQKIVCHHINVRYAAVGTTLSPLEWDGGYIANFERKRKEYSRNVLIITKDMEPTDCIMKAVEHSAKLIGNNKAFGNIDCYAFTEIPEISNLIDNATLEYGINLNILDIERLAEQTMTDALMRRILVPASSSTVSRNIFKFSRKEKIIFDLFTTGAKVADIKHGFVSAFVQYALFENGPMPPLDLRKVVKASLPSLTDTTFNETLSRESENGNVEYDKTVARYKLTDSGLEKLQQTTDATAAIEQNLVEEFDACLESHGVKNLAKAVMQKITALYKSHYEGEMSLIDGNDQQEKNDHKLYDGLLGLLQQQGKEVSECRQVVRELLTIVGKSEYLNKTSLTGMLTSMFNSDKLEAYMDTQPRIVMLDTQILLRYLCLLYQDTEYNDSFYDAVKLLKKQLYDSRDYVRLYTTTGYIQEVVNHLWEAHSLQRFLSLPYIEDMGPSKNVFFNYYLYLLREEKMKFIDFDDFLSQMLGYDDQIPSGYNTFSKDLFPVVAELFALSGFEIVTLDNIEDMLPYQKAYDYLLGTIGIKYKNPQAKDRDILCSHYLSDERNFVNQKTTIPEEPFFVTLDSTMLPFRKIMVGQFQRNRYYVYPPMKFANRLAVMNLKINSDNINYNIICLAEKNFMASNDTISMMDIISSIMTGDNFTDMATPQQLAALKRQQMDDVTAQDFASRHHDNLPIDMVLNDISRHYRQPSINKSFELSRLFQNNEMTDALLSLLKDNCAYYMENQRVKPDLFGEIDKMMIK